MRRLVILFLLFICLLAGGLQVQRAFASRNSSSQQKLRTFRFGNVELQLEVAKTDAERRKGLSGRSRLESNQAMVFLFPEADIYDFWMKDTYFPLDILWLYQGKVVDMTTLPAQIAGKAPAQYSPKAIADQVIEVSAGLAKAQEIGIGSVLQIPKLCKEIP